MEAEYSLTAKGAKKFLKSFAIFAVNCETIPLRLSVKKILI